MPLGDADRPGLAHRRQSFRRCGQQLPNGVGQAFHVPGRDQPAVNAVAHQFRNAGDKRADDRPAQGQRFHQHDRQPLGEARQHQAAGGLDLTPNVRSAQPAGDPHFAR